MGEVEMSSVEHRRYLYNQPVYRYFARLWSEPSLASDRLDRDLPELRSGVSEMDTCGDVRFSCARLFSVVIVACILGCGSSVPFDFVPVHGKVTYDDGSLIEADSILVTFNPILAEEKGRMVPPGGQTNINVSDGTFSAVSSHRKDDGVALGRHKVVVVAFKKGPNGAPVPTAAVPPVYRNVSSTPLEVEVDSSDQFLELKINKK
jgi:hypothetical protein